MGRHDGLPNLRAVAVPQPQDGATTKDSTLLEHDDSTTEHDDSTFLSRHDNLPNLRT